MLFFPTTGDDTYEHASQRYIFFTLFRTIRVNSEVNKMSEAEPIVHQSPRSKIAIMRSLSMSSSKVWRRCAVCNDHHSYFFV